MADKNHPSGSEYALIPRTTNTASAHGETCKNFTVNSKIYGDNPNEYSSQTFPHNSSTNLN